MSKTPFEIRLDLLNLAQSILSDNVWAQRHRLENDWNLARENKESALRSMRDDAPDTPFAQPFPTISSATAEEIIETARKLNAFIGEKE